MTMQIDPSDPVSVDTVNKKLEAFVEVLLQKLVDTNAELKALKKRVRTLEKANSGV